MSLRKYRQKRDFSKTAEPKARKNASSTGRLFVVQKHDASRLHYDFRLEIDGVLASWAVPKGFPSQQGERRLAVHVEDHPLDYVHFEGVIPAGQYGGGTVMVWDTGTYEVFGTDPATALREGKLHLCLRGRKLRGEWTLVRGGRGGDEKAWFLIKTGGSVKPPSKAAEDHSALTMRQIGSDKTAVWESGGASRKSTGAIRKSKAPSGKSNGRKAEATAVTSAAKSKDKPPAGLALEKAGRERPHWIAPMKAKLVETPPAGDAWRYELKWDGYRAVAIKDGSKVELVSRNEKPLTEEFPEVAEAISALEAKSAVLDGEICALDAHGRPRFQLLQKRALGEARPPIFYYAFDLLHLHGQDLTGLPLTERKSLLESLLTGTSAAVRYSASLEGGVRALLRQVQARGLEGLIGKRADSLYEAGKRSGSWIKIKVASEQEFVIGGYTPPQGTRKYFGALLVGYYRGAKFCFAGKVGTGFDHALLKRLHEMLHRLEVSKCPFSDLPRTRESRWGQAMTAAQMRLCKWVRPKLVCQVRFAEWTADGSLRQPVFLGLREDKSAREVIRENPE